MCRIKKWSEVWADKKVALYIITHMCTHMYTLCIIHHPSIYPPIHFSSKYLYLSILFQVFEILKCPWKSCSWRTLVYKIKYSPMTQCKLTEEEMCHFLYFWKSQYAEKKQTCSSLLSVPWHCPNHHIIHVYFLSLLFLIKLLM